MRGPFEMDGMHSKTSHNRHARPWVLVCINADTVVVLWFVCRVCVANMCAISFIIAGEEEKEVEYVWQALKVIIRRAKTHVISSHLVWLANIICSFGHVSCVRVVSMWVGGCVRLDTYICIHVLHTVFLCAFCLKDFLAIFKCVSCALCVLLLQYSQQQPRSHKIQGFVECFVMFMCQQAQANIILP